MVDNNCEHKRKAWLSFMYFKKPLCLDCFKILRDISFGGE